MSDIYCWLQSSTRRVYPKTSGPEGQPQKLIAGRDDGFSFQVCVRNNAWGAITVKAAVETTPDISLRVRRVGYVPIQHLNTETDFSDIEGFQYIPGFVPDPLFNEDTVTIGPWETHSFWINGRTNIDCAPGIKNISVTVTREDEILSKMNCEVEVTNLLVGTKQNFPVMHWFYADSLCDWYKVEPFDDAFWKIVEPYIADLVQHGNDAVYVPLFTPPTDGVKRPTQLLNVSTPSEGKYEFDFSNVKKWTKLAQKNGAKYFEWTHLFWQWGVKYALRIYKSNQDPNSLLWSPETGATSDTYRNFLAQFLPKFKEFLDAEDLMDKSFFHLSDEPHGDEHLANYRAARMLLKELAPWMKVLDALSDIAYGREGLTDIPIPSIGTAMQYIEEGIPSFAYYCCGPRGRFLNRLQETPLTKIRMNGWLFFALKAGGFLHWGYNYWYKSQTQEMKDPFVDQANGWWPGGGFGDTTMVYPGLDGPLDSIRWEVFSDSLQDYALLQAGGITPGHKLLNAINDYENFPRYEGWVYETREKILRGEG